MQDKPIFQKLIFPVTLSMIWLFTLVLVFSVDKSGDIWGSLLLFFFLYGMGSFLIESFFLKSSHGYLFYIALGVNLFPSLFLTLLPTVLFDYFDFYSERVTETVWSSYFVRCCGCYALILFLLGIYFCQKRSGFSLSQYLVQVFAKTLRYHIIYFILMVGTTLILAILSELFNLNFDLFMQVQMLLFGLYFMSSFLLSFYPQEEENRLLASALVKYVLPVMVTIAFVIIYAYILKTLILRNIPSNALFRITAGLFILGMPVCLMNSAYRENNPLFRITKWLPALFLPFLLLQGYSIGIRIYENGITPLRYAAVAFLLFECAALAFAYFQYQRLSLLLPLAAATVFFSCFVPVINMNYLSFLSQKATLEHYLDLPEEMQQTVLTARVTNGNTPERIRGAYSYLRYDHFGELYLYQLDSEEKQVLEKLSEYGSADYEEFSTTTRYFARRDAICIDVAGYSSCYPVDVSEYYWDRAEEDTAAYNDFLSDFQLRDDIKPLLTADLYQLFTFYMDHADRDEEIETYFQQHFTYELSEDRTLYITTLSFTYDQSYNTFPTFRVEGYVLEK